MASDSKSERPAAPRARGGNGRAVTIVVPVFASAALGAIAGAAGIAGNRDVAIVIVALFVFAWFLWAGMMRICARIDRLGARFGAPVTSMEPPVGRLEDVSASGAGAAPVPPHGD